MTFPFPTIYHDGQSLYLEFPGKPGQVLRFALTEGGLHKALKHIPNMRQRSNWLHGTNGQEPKVTVAPSTRRRRELAKQSSGVRNAATDLIRKLKIGE